MKKFLTISVILFLINSINTFSQNKREDLEYKFDVAKVVNDTSITYYGWDFRFLIFNDPKFPEAKDVIIKLLPGLRGIIDDRFGPEYMERRFLKKHFVYNPRAI